MENVARVAQSAGRHRMTPGVGFAFAGGGPQLASSMSFVPCRAGKPREKGPLARDGTTRRAACHEPADTTQQHCAQRAWRRLPCVHWRPGAVQGGGKRYGLEGAVLLEPGYLVLGLSAALPVVPRFASQRPARCNFVLLGGIWIVMQNLPGRCGTKPAVGEHPASH
jgi:hypothetical protein